MQHYNTMMSYPCLLPSRLSSVPIFRQSITRPCHICDSLRQMASRENILPDLTVGTVVPTVPASVPAFRPETSARGLLPPIGNFTLP